MNAFLMAIYFVCAYVQFKENRYGVLFFYFTFFLFLLDTVFFGLFDKTLKFNYLSDEEECFILVCLTITVVGVYIGASINATIKTNREKKRNPKLDWNDSARPNVSPKMQTFLKISYLFCAIAEMANMLTKAIFVSKYSYVEYYVDFASPLPYAVIWIASISPFLFYLFLGSLPSKNSVIIPCGVYLLIGVIGLFFGQRNILVTRILIVLVYFLIRDKFRKRGEERWIRPGQIKAIILLVPFGIIFMSFWDSYRSGIDYQNNGFVENILNALLIQGNCISILDFEYRYGDLIPDRMYALGGIISFLHDNLIGRLIGLEQIPTQGNVAETALYGYSFSSALMYVENRTGYLMGFGIGSCFIAELHYSFGYIGVFLGSLLYGVILKKIGEVRIRGFMYNGLVLYMFEVLLMSPRSSFDGFLSRTFQLANILVLIICFFFSRYVWPYKQSRGDDGEIVVDGTHV